MAGILGGTPDRPIRPKAAPVLPATPGLKVTHRGSRTIGTVVLVNAEGVTVRTVAGVERIFRLLPEGFIVEGKIVTLAFVRPKATPKVERTASGSIASTVPRRARVARAGRLWVEGIHDAELVEKVWGDDLREAGIVVERLDGIDGLVFAVLDFDPGPGRPLGILVDHLVPGSKESRIAERVRRPYVSVTGTPYVDVWQAVRPARLGIEAWPEIPRNEEWKAGVCRRLRWDPAPGMAWRKILGAVRSYVDLEPAVVGAVEELIDDILAGMEDER